MVTICGTRFSLDYIPTDGVPEETSVGRMRDELVMRGVPAEQILMETALVYRLMI